LGGKKESRRKTKSFEPEKGCPYSCRQEETFGTDEGALGSQKENRQISNCGGYQHPADGCW